MPGQRHRVSDYLKIGLCASRVQISRRRERGPHGADMSRSAGTRPWGEPPSAILFTDLDGTLLDYDGYGWAPAAPALRTLMSHGVAVVPCSSKTLAEQRMWAREMGMAGPFVVENGSAVVLPEGLIPEGIEGVADGGTVRRTHDHEIVVLGMDRPLVLDALRRIRTVEGIVFRGYADMTLEAIRKQTGLSASAAELARARDFSETVHVTGGPAAWERFMEALRKHGLHSFGAGPTGTVVGLGADKGRAVRVVTEIFRRIAGAARPLPTAAVGDAFNDEPMLRAVERPFLVECRGGGWADLAVEGMSRVRGVGPVGWARAAARFLEEVSPR
ncbi:MAG: HAD hydrolase family protein [Gemmatimonadota bacterium]|jgi:mannosyl-3-phosphoglycerate phosphatase family protein